MRGGRIFWCCALIPLFIGFAPLFGEVKAQCPDTIPPKVRLVACGSTTVKLVFDESQPAVYDSHWVSWGDGNIQQLFPRLKAVSHTFATAGSQKITVWGISTPNLCKTNEVVLDYNPTTSAIARPAISEFEMLTKNSGELTVKNPSDVELLLYRKSGSGDWESTGRTISKDNQQLEVFVDSLTSACFRLQSTDTCLVEGTRSEPVCSGSLKMSNQEKFNELSYVLPQAAPGTEIFVKKDGTPWREITAQGESGVLNDAALSCGQEHCYQLSIVGATSRFTALPVCRRTPVSICGVEAPLFAPSAFSPNGDGINDFFEIKGEVAADYELTVFNSWGTAIFRSRSITQSWDGKLDGTPLPPGFYAYKIIVGAKGSSFVKTGSVLVLK